MILDKNAKQQESFNLNEEILDHLDESNAKTFFK